MKSRLRQKVPKCRTKKGLSLVELIVGITIIAMVLASASGAIVTGYKTTIDNAERNKAAASSASMNEVILKAIKNCGLADEGEAEEQFFLAADGETATTPDQKADEPVYAAVQILYPGVKYSQTNVFSDANGDYQYYLNPSAERVLEESGSANIRIKGIEITTAVAVGSGFERIISFVPYNGQNFENG